MEWAIALVFFGGAVGSMWRYWWSGLVAQRFGETFPFGTLVVNITGSTIAGVVAGLLVHVSNSGSRTALEQLLIVGVCGGLTTFSSFGLQTYNLIMDRQVAFGAGLYCLFNGALLWVCCAWLANHTENKVLISQ